MTKNQFWTGVFSACLALGAPSLAVAQTLTGTGGQVWDVDGAAGGTIINGTSDSYDGMYSLSVGGTAYSAAGVAAAVDAGGRRLTTAVRPIAGLSVQRRIFVPAATTWWGDATSGFARYEEILTNAGAGSVTTTVIIGGNLGSDGSTVRTGSSTGDIVLDGTDDWVATDDLDGAGDPSLSHILQGDGAASRATFAMSFDTPSWTFSVTVPAGATRRIVYFAVQATSRTNAHNMAERVRLWSIPDQWDNLTAAELGQVVNWNFAATFTVDNSIAGLLADVTVGTGALTNGTSDSYDSMYYADVNGAQYNTTGMPILRLEAGRLLVMAPQTIGAVRAQRLWWTAATGSPLSRASVIVHNPSTIGVATTTRISGNLGSDLGTVPVGSSSGDAVISATDHWAITDDVDAGGDPTLVHVLDDATGPAAFALTTDNLEWTYAAATVPAGDANIWTFFAGQAANRAAATTLAQQTRMTGQFTGSAPFPASENMAAWAPAWSSRSRTFAMTYEHLLSTDGHNYDVNITDGGQLSNGLVDAYDDAYYLDLGATRVVYTTAFGITRLSASGYIMPAVTTAGLLVQRRYFVPTTGASGFVRFYNLFGNPDGAVGPNVTMSGNLGSDGSTVATGSSDGDLVFEPSDSWLGTDDADASVDPSLTHVTKRNGPVTEEPDVASRTADQISWTYNAVAIGANTQLALMMYGVQAANRATAAARADVLDDLGGDATTGLSAAEIALAANFNVTTLPNGAVCTLGTQCTSTFCTDGVCCNNACAGGATDCQACSLAAGAAVAGTCGALSAAIAPTVTCRASAATCDAAEICATGSTACPADAFAAAGTGCRASAGLCDVAETCSGAAAACPADAVAGAGTSCRAAAGACDVAETCTGATAACPADGVAAVGTACRAASGVCDVAEACDGAAPACPADMVLAAGTSCRAAAGTCDVAEACTGALGMCPADGFAADGFACGDGAVCNGDETCSAGVCAAGTTLGCDDADACTADSCAEPTGCGHTAIASCCNVDTDCDDGDVCTDDVCDVGNVCAFDPIAGCGDTDGGTIETDGGTIDTDGGTIDVDAGATDGSVGGDASTADAGTVRTRPDADGGCGCSVPGADDTRSKGLGLLGLGLLAIVVARRRRR